MYWLWYLCQEVRALASFPLTHIACFACLLTFLNFRCPFEAIAIINLPTNLESQVTHRYTANAFKLHRLPTPRPGQVLGLVGTNGIGKSTALKILAGQLKPNLGRYDVRLTLPPLNSLPTFLLGSPRLAGDSQVLPWI